LIDLQIKHHFSGREYAKQMTLPLGRVLVDIDGVRRELEGPDCIVIPAGRKHRIEALTDSVWFCVHATEETDPARVDSVLIKES